MEEPQHKSTGEVPALAARPDAVEVRRRLTSIFGGSVGNLVEWYDWYVYSAFSLYFAKSFFPKGDQTAQLLDAAAVFALGFVVRPIGGLVMGRYADRHGRKAALTLSVLAMCAGSLVIAVTPTYATIGVFAPIALVLARLLQGLSVGGEYGASATYLSEMATPSLRGFYSSFQYVTLILGQLLALAVLIVLQRVALTPAELEAWGWRIPFGVGALAATTALYLRKKLEETGSFTAAARRHAPHLGDLRELFRHPRALLTVVGLTMGGTVAFYTYTTYMQKFLVNTVGLTKGESTAISAGTLTLFMAIQPLAGLLSDRIGRRPLLLGFGVLGTVFTVPILTALSQAKSATTAFMLIMAALVIVTGYTSINAVVKAELFPTEVRALGVGLPYAVTVSIFGGSAEYLALFFKSRGHERWFYGYVTGCIAASLIVYLWMRETRADSRMEAPRSPPPG